MPLSNYILSVAHFNSADWLEHWDEESVDEYMDILRTATILEQIHNGLAGMHM